MSSQRDIKSMSKGLTPEIAKRLLNQPGDAGIPLEWQPVGDALASLQAEPTLDELNSENRIVAAMMAAHRGDAVSPGLYWRTRIYFAMLRSKFVAMVASAALITTTALAYANALPTTFQRTTSGVLAHIGLNVPNPDDKEDSNNPSGGDPSDSNPQKNDSRDGNDENDDENDDESSHSTTPTTDDDDSEDSGPSGSDDDSDDDNSHSSTTDGSDDDSEDESENHGSSNSTTPTTEDDDSEDTHREQSSSGSDSGSSGSDDA